MQVAPAVSQPRFFHLAATDSEVWEASDRLRGGSAPSGGARRERIVPAVAAVVSENPSTEPLRSQRYRDS
jgi:hypothetical protein